MYGLCGTSTLGYEGWKSKGFRSLSIEVKAEETRVSWRNFGFGETAECLTIVKVAGNG
jgi:hypothetical protein